MIVVNPATRQLNIPGADLVFGVTADANSAVKHFQCPRYVGNNVDIASSFVRINYQNAHGDIDFYLVKDVTVDGENVTFSWELHPKVTMYKGNVSFVMCVTGPDAKVKWHTTLGRGQVLEGLEPDNALVETDTKDGIAALIAMVEAQTVAVDKTGADQAAVVKAAAKTAQDSAVAQIEAKGASTLATIPGEYTAAVNAVQSAANAIRGKASGEVIRVDDVSPMEHYPKIRVHGKNLFDTSKIQVMPESNQNAYVREVGSDYIIVTTQTGYTGNGFCTIKQTLREVCPSLEVGKAYTLTATTESTSVNIYLYLTQTVWLFGKPMIVTEEMLNSAVTFYGLSEKEGFGTGDCIISNIQIEEGTVATEYAPYIDPTTITVARGGRNLLDLGKCTFSNCTVVENGVKASIGGVYYCEVYPNYLRDYLQNHDGVTLTFSVRNTIPGGYIAIVILYEDGTYSQKTSETNTTTLTINNQGRTIRYVVVRPIAKRETFTDTTSIATDMQLEIGSSATEYKKTESLAETTPAPDGTVTGLKSASPTMTLLTDTRGVTIDCEYSRDTNKVIEDILNKLAALVGNN